MFKFILLTILSMVSLVVLALLPEFTSLPSLRNTLFHLTNLPYFSSLFLTSFILFSQPLIIIVVVLSNLKKFVFNHTKNIYKCYVRAFLLLLISYSLFALLNCLSFLVDLAFKEYYYFIVRISYLFPHSHYPHIFSVNMLVILVIQSSIFSMAFLLTEIILTFKFKVTSMKLADFLKRNFFCIAFTVFCFITNISLLIWIESRYFNFSIDKFHRSFDILDKIIESTLITAILMYLYTIMAIYEN